MGKATAEAPANLAFVKYWGKLNSELNLPCNSSISMNLSNARTITTVEFDPAFPEDRVLVRGRLQVDPDFVARTVEHLDRIRSRFGAIVKARVTTRNTFPSSVGIASSASGFAALTVAATAALGIQLDTRELSILARLGSGSASRSIPDGFVEWHAGMDSDSSYSIQIAPPDHWDISVVTVVVSEERKKSSSTSGHALARTSPYFEQRLAMLPRRLEVVRRSILDRDFTTFGREVEQEAISLHMVAMTSPVSLPEGWLSGIYYWTPETLQFILAIQGWRQAGLEVYFTLDAGPTVHILAQSGDVPALLQAIQNLPRGGSAGAWDVMVNVPAPGARVLPEGDPEDKDHE